jgi:hypothetical protein
LLGFALVMPALRAGDDDDHHRNKHQDSRYYDQDARDWHDWNGNEEKAYREYLRERNREHRDWAKMNRKEQKQYWKWRHKHTDSSFGGEGYRDRDDRDRDDRHHRDRDDDRH